MLPLQVSVIDENRGKPLFDVATLYRRHLPLVRRRAERLLGDDDPALGEIVTEAFAKLLEHRLWHASPETLASALYRSVTNLSLNRLRESARQKELSALRKGRRAAGDTPPPTDAQVMRQVLAQVSYDEAQVAAYYYIDGLEAVEIATLLGVEKRTVLQRLACFDARAPRLLGLAARVVRHVA